MQGLVAGDENGPVSVANPPDLSRFKTVVDKKSTVSSAPFTTTPPTADANVYHGRIRLGARPEILRKGNFRGQVPRIPSSSAWTTSRSCGTPRILEVQGPKPVTSDAYIAKTITLTEALKDQFPNILIFGPGPLRLLGHLQLARGTERDTQRHELVPRQISRSAQDGVGYVRQAAGGRLRFSLVRGGYDANGNRSPPTSTVRR